jgi:6-phosphogluconate dehydrogenase (decarboxylating)
MSRRFGIVRITMATAWEIFKVVSNKIDYAMMPAHAEGWNSLRHTHAGNGKVEVNV